MKTPEGSLKALLSAYAAFLVVVGIVFFAGPTATLGLYGTHSLTSLESVLAQSLGAVMVGLGVVCWIARLRAEQRGPAVLGLIVMSALWTVVCVRAAFLFDGNWFFWGEGAGFAAITLFLLAIRYGGEKAP